MNWRTRKKNDELTRKGRRIQLALHFWTRVATFTRFGLHGFVLWMIRRAYMRAVEFNVVAKKNNRRERKERRRLEAIGRH